MQSGMQTSGIPPRKVFNCIVDESALVAGVKTATRNGIRQWVKNGQIRLFVPLHGIAPELALQVRVIANASSQPSTSFSDRSGAIPAMAEMWKRR